MMALFLLVYVLMLRPIQKRALAAAPRNQLLATPKAAAATDADAAAIGETAANLRSPFPGLEKAVGRVRQG